MQSRSATIHDFLRSLMLPLREIEISAPKNGRIFDMGCGEGTISRYLARNKNRKVVGIDLNVKRLQRSSQTNLKFISEDIRVYKTTNANCVIFSDVLHHLNFSDQKKLLRNIYKNMKKGGTLIIKEIDTSEFIRSRLSRFWDFVFYPKEKIYFSSSSELVKSLKKLGFKVELQKPCRLFPGSTTLLTCKK